MDYAATIRSLAAPIGANVITDAVGPRDAYSTLSDDTGTPELHVQPITDESGYWVALHELGHLYLHHVQAKDAWIHDHQDEINPFDLIFGGDPYPKDKLQVMEAAATEWALAHGGGIPSPKAAAFLQAALESYNDPGLSFNGERVDHPDASYLGTIAKLKGYAKGEVYTP